MNTPRILATTIAALLLTARAFAVTDTWDGGGVDNNLSTGLNWLDNSAPVSDLANTDLIFAGAVRLTPNVSTDFSAKSITFNNTAGAFVIGGSILTIGAGGIFNNDTQAQRFDNTVVIGNAAASFNAASGPLTFTGSVDVPLASSLSLDGAGAFSFGNFSGSGTVTKTGAGTMTYAPVFLTQQGDLVINAGTVNMAVTGVTGTFSGTASIAVNGTSTLNINESLTLTGGAQLTRAAAGTVTVAAGKTLRIEVGSDFVNSGNHTVAGGDVQVVGGGSTFQNAGILTINGGATLAVQSGGSVGSSSFLDIGISTNGTLTVDGAGSFASAAGSGNSNWGRSFGLGSFATVTFSNNATGSFAGLNMGVNANSGASVQILSGADITNAGSLLLGIGSGGTGNLLVVGAGSSWLQTAGGTTIGAASGGSGSLTVQSGGTFTGGTGTTAVNATGAVNIVGGTFNANGNFTVMNGGVVSRDATGVFNLASGKTLTMQSGGDFTVTGSFAQSTNASFIVSGAGSTFSASSGLTFNAGSTVNVLLGGALSGSLGALGIGTVGSGTVTVDGAGSTVAATALDLAGNALAANGTLTLTNGGAGSFGTMNVGLSSLGSTVGTLNIQSGSTVTSNALSIATNAAANTGTVTINGAGSALTVTGSSTSIGTTDASTATLNVQNFGVFNSGTGTVTVNTSGTIAISGGTFQVGANLTLNGGQLTRDAAGTLSLPLGVQMAVQGGGDAIFTGAFQQLVRASLNVSGVGSTFTTTGDFQWESGDNTLAFVGVSGGGLLSSGGSLHLGRNNTAVSLTASGAGTQLNASPFFTSEWQAGVLIVNGASATLGGLRIADANFAGGSFASLGVQSGSTVSLGNLAIATVVATANGSLTVDGPGSTVTQTGSSTLGLGAAFATTASLSVNNGGAFTSATGTFTLNPTGVLNVSGGTATFNGLLTNNGGVVSFTSGALLFNNPGVNLTVGNAGLLGQNVTLTSAQRLLIGGTTTIEPFRTLALNGGTFTTSTLVNNGTIAFNSGTLAITGAGGFNIGTGALGSNVTLGTGANLQVTNAATIASGATLTLNGGSVVAGTLNNSGTLRANFGTVSAANGTNTSGGRIFIGDTLEISGTLTNVSGGRITLENGSGLLSGAGSLSNNGVVTGDGTITKPLVNAGNGEVRGELGRTLNFTNGGSNIGQFNLLGGTLDFSTSALTNNPTGFISGHGALFTGSLANQGVMAFSGGTTDIRGDTTNASGARIVTSGAGAVTTFYDDVVHNGLEIFTGASASTVFFGGQSGAGPFTGTGTIYFNGDLRPGNSPASISYGGDVAFGGASSLTLEIGGLIAGTQYDRLKVAGTLFEDGVLAVSLYGGFAPHFGDTFDLFDAGAVAGGFDTVNLPDLAGDLEWDATNLQSTGQLRVVPEPGIAGLLTSALALLGLRRLR